MYNRSMKKVYIGIVCCIVLAFTFLTFNSVKINKQKKLLTAPVSITISPFPTNPLSIPAMRKQSYPGSALTILQTLPDGNNYHAFIVSYQSQDLAIHALLTIPIGQKPQKGWPVIIFNHGYIPPQTYQTNPTVGQYATYLPVFAENDYIVLKPDFRGNGNSQGKPEGAYYSPAYAIDDLNAIASMRQYPNANPQAIGIWAHSMGGNVALRVLVVKPEWITAAVIWGGVVGTYEDLQNWHDPFYHPTHSEQADHNQQRFSFVKKYGTPSATSPFWSSIDPTNFLQSISTPIQLDVGGNDEEVPPSFSLSLSNALKNKGKTVTFYSYPGADHNISQSFTNAMQNSLTFFHTYLQNGKN